MRSGIHFLYSSMVSTTTKLSYSTSLVSLTTMSFNDVGKGKEPLKPSYREKVVKGSSSNSKSWADEMEELDNDVAEVDLNESAITITDHCADWEIKYWRSKYSIRECGGLEPYGLIGKVLGWFVNLKSITERMQAVWKQAGMKGGVQIKAMGGLSVQICKRWILKRRYY